MIEESQLCIGLHAAGMRLDRFLAGAFPSSTKALIHESIKAGDVCVNGRPAAKSFRLVEGASVHVKRLMEARDIRVAPNNAIGVDVVFEDADLLAVNKPAGIPVHPLHYSECHTLANGLVARFPELQGIGDDPLFPALVHRIDNGTSGLVVAARTDEAYRDLRQQFRKRSVVKRYVALVHGRVRVDQELRNVLAHDPRRRGRMLVVDHRDHVAPGEQRFEAISQVDVRQVLGAYTLVDVTIESGITHQIRAQLAHLGHPVVGDEVYGRRSDLEILPGRHFLHARGLVLRHPRTDRTMHLHAPLPGELATLLRTLGVDR